LWAAVFPLPTLFMTRPAQNLNTKTKIPVKIPSKSEILAAKMIAVKAKWTKIFLLPYYISHALISTKICPECLITAQEGLII
jgi:hypothetical protein